MGLGSYFLYNIFAFIFWGGYNFDEEMYLGYGFGLYVGLCTYLVGWGRLGTRLWHGKTGFLPVT